MNENRSGEASGSSTSQASHAPLEVKTSAGPSMIMTLSLPPPSANAISSESESRASSLMTSLSRTTSKGGFGFAVSRSSRPTTEPSCQSLTKPFLFISSMPEPVWNVIIALPPPWASRSSSFTAEASHALISPPHCGQNGVAAFENMSLKKS